MTEIMIYAHDNRQDYLPKDPIPQAVTDQGVIVSNDSIFAPILNKEQWHEDPFANLADKVKAENKL